MFIVNNIYKSYGELPVLDNISMEIEKGKITAILGPSGCGKTTLLRVLAGLTKPNIGTLSGFDEQISYVFQQPRLLPWCNVYDNIKLVLENKMPSEDIPNTIQKVLRIVELADFASEYPNKLSGGMQQRVSIARALAMPSQIMFLDEPFKSLDYDLKQRLLRILLPLWTEEKYSIFIVTHDVHVASLAGDIIYLLSQRPSSIYKQLDNPVLRTDRIYGSSRALTEMESDIYSSLSDQ